MLLVLIFIAAIIGYFFSYILLPILRFIFGPIFEYAYESAIRWIQKTFNLQDRRAARAILHGAFALLIIIIFNA